MLSVFADKIMTLTDEEKTKLNGIYYSRQVLGTGTSKIVLYADSSDELFQCDTLLAKMGVSDLIVNYHAMTLSFNLSGKDWKRLEGYTDIGFVADSYSVPRTQVSKMQPQNKEFSLVAAGAPTHEQRIALRLLPTLFAQSGDELVYGGPKGNVYIPRPIEKLKDAGFDASLFAIEGDPAKPDRITAGNEALERFAQIGFLPAMRMVMRRQKDLPQLEAIDRAQQEIASFGIGFSNTAKSVMFQQAFDSEQACQGSRIYQLLEEIGGNPVHLTTEGKSYVALTPDDAGRLSIMGIDALNGMGTKYRCAEKKQVGVAHAYASNYSGVV